MTESEYDAEIARRNALYEEHVGAKDRQRIADLAAKDKEHGQKLDAANAARQLAERRLASEAADHESALAALRNHHQGEFAEIIRQHERYKRAIYEQSGSLLAFTRDRQSADQIRNLASEFNPVIDAVQGLHKQIDAQAAQLVVSRNLAAALKQFFEQFGK